MVFERNQTRGRRFSSLLCQSAQCPVLETKREQKLLSGLPASGSSYLPGYFMENPHEYPGSPRLPVSFIHTTVALSHTGYAAFVPGYGGGSATDFNRLPFGLYFFYFINLRAKCVIMAKKIPGSGR